MKISIARIYAFWKRQQIKAVVLNLGLKAKVLNLGFISCLVFTQENGCVHRQEQTTQSQVHHMHVESQLFISSGCFKETLLMQVVYIYYHVETFSFCNVQL